MRLMPVQYEWIARAAGNAQTYPTTAQMSTYTYAPLMGITAACSVKSQISYYGYDNVGRLITIKDQYGNITKALTYHYAGQ